MSLIQYPPASPELLSLVRSSVKFPIFKLFLMNECVLGPQFLVVRLLVNSFQMPLIDMFGHGPKLGGLV